MRHRSTIDRPVILNRNTLVDCQQPCAFDLILDIYPRNIKHHLINPLSVQISYFTATAAPPEQQQRVMLGDRQNGCMKLSDISGVTSHSFNRTCHCQPRYIGSPPCSISRADGKRRGSLVLTFPHTRSEHQDDADITNTAELWRYYEDNVRPDATPERRVWGFIAQGGGKDRPGDNCT